MPVAICNDCEGTTHWRNQRGVSIKDMRCKCGGKLSRAELNQGGKWVKAKKKAKFNCGTCHRNQYRDVDVPATEPCALCVWENQRVAQ